MLKVNSLNQTIIVPEIISENEVTYRVMKNTMIGALAQELDIKIPYIIKYIKIEDDYEDYRERRYFLKQQLKPITPESCPEVFGMKIQCNYEPIFLMGSKRATVLYSIPEITSVLKNLYNTPEESQSYKAPINEFQAYGLFNLSNINIKIISDDQGDMNYDGIGFASDDVMDSLSAKDLIQFRAANSGLKEGGILKGLLRRDSNLPASTIHFTQSQIKGKYRNGEIESSDSLWLGVLRQYNKTSRCKMSWTIHELPDFQFLKEKYIPEARKTAHELMDVASDVYKAGDYLGLFGEDNEDQSYFPTLHQLIRIAAGAKSNDKPDLALHPFIQKGLAEDIVCGKLKDLALNGPWRLPYLISTGCTAKYGKGAVLCHVGKIGQKVTLHRFPFILSGVTATIVGRPELKNEIICSDDIREAIALDDDGDAVVVSTDIDFISATDKARNRLGGNIEKCKEKKSSTWWEFVDVLSEQAISLGGIGTATYATLSSAIAQDHDVSKLCANHLQRATDSRKHNVKADISYCREVFEKYGLPPWISIGKTEKSQFKQKCDSFKSVLWENVREVWDNRRVEQIDKTLNLRCYANIFGHTHGLDKNEYRECVLLYRYWCSSVKRISEIESEEDRKLAMGQLVDLIRSITSTKDKRFTICSWELAHSQQSKANRATYCFLCFPLIYELLIDAYKSEEIKRCELDNGDGVCEGLTDKLYKGMHGDLFSTGFPLKIESNTIDETSSKKIMSIAIVNIKNITPADLANAIVNNEVTVEEDAERFIPALELCGLYLSKGSTKLAEISDDSIHNYLESDGLNGEVIVYSKSIKIVSTK